MRTKSNIASLIEMFQGDLDRLNAIPRPAKRVKALIPRLNKQLADLRAELETAPE